MNCQDFEKLVVDLADGRLIEAATREQLTTHAGGCARCAARLAFEQGLNGHLKTLAAADSTIEAPAGVKRELMAAFAERRGAPAIAQQAPRSSRWLLASAAAVLIAVSATAGLWLRMNQGNGVDSGVKPQPTASARPAAQKPPIFAPSVKTMVTDASMGDQKPAVTPAQTREITRRAKTIANFKNRQLALATSQETETEEAATDYLPLTSVALIEPAEIQQVVRLEVPRSMLMMWGVPVNTDRTRTTVKADLVIGEDGVARAIRLVN